MTNQRMKKSTGKQEFVKNGANSCNDKAHHQPERDSIMTKWMAIISFAVSLISLSASLKSCAISNETLAMNREDFDSKRAITFKADVLADGEHLQIAPSDKDINLQNIEITFPKKIPEIRLPGSATATILPIRGMVEYLVQEFRQNFKKQKENHVVPMGLFEGAIPIAIEAKYVAAGKLYVRRSLYGVEFNGYIDQTNELRRPVVKFSKLLYFNDLKDGERAKDAVEASFSNVKAESQLVGIRDGDKYYPIEGLPDELADEFRKQVK